MASAGFKRFISSVKDSISFPDVVGISGLALLYRGITLTFTESYAMIVIGALLIILGAVGAYSQNRD